MTHLDTVIGKVLRLPLRFIQQGSVLPVMSGPLRGSRWVVGASVHGCWIGWYEKEKAWAFSEAVTEDAVVWDIGANVGYYTLIAARKVATSRVLAIEPLRSNVAFLRRHLELNRLTHVRVLEAAVSDHDGEEMFEEAQHNSQGRLGAVGSLRVQVFSFDGLLRQAGLPGPTLIKMDIEGGEYDALRGGISVLREYRPTIFLATHGLEIHRKCCELLRELQYDLSSMGNVPLEQSDELVGLPRGRRDAR